MKQKGKREPAPSGVHHRETTRDERLRIIALRENAHWNWSQIERELGIGRRTCQRIYERWKVDGTPSNRKRPGRPVIFDDEEKVKLEAFVTRDKGTRRVSWEDVVREMGYACSARTVQNAMQKMGYTKSVPRKRFHVSAENKKKRVAWCQERLHWTREEWKRVIWTDECSFSTSGFGAGQPWVIRKADEEYHSDCIDENTPSSGRNSQMIWGAFCGTTKCELVDIPGKAKVDSLTYVRTVLEPALVPFWQRCCEEYGWAVVQEDNAPGHKKHAIEYRQLNGMEALDWPAQSPDLNPMGVVWERIETELGEIWGRVSDIETLKLCIQTAWEKVITEEVLYRLVEGMPARLQTVIDAGGNPIPY